MLLLLILVFFIPMDFEPHQRKMFSLSAAKSHLKFEFVAFIAKFLIGLKKLKNKLVVNQFNSFIFIIKQPIRKLCTLFGSTFLLNFFMVSTQPERLNTKQFV